MVKQHAIVALLTLQTLFSGDMCWKYDSVLLLWLYRDEVCYHCDAEMECVTMVIQRWSVLPY